MPDREFYIDDCFFSGFKVPYLLKHRHVYSDFQTFSATKEHKAVFMHFGCCPSLRMGQHRIEDMNKRLI